MLMDVHDRALFYYMLLQYDVAVAEHVVDPPKQAVSIFADMQSSEVKDHIFDEFNDLSVVYQKPSYMFIDKEHRGPFEFSEELGGLSVGAESEVNVIQAQRFEANDNDLLLGTSEMEEIRVPSNNGSGYSALDFDASSASLATMQMPSQTAYSSSTLPTNATQTSSGIDDLLGLGLPAPAVPSQPLLKLNAKPVLDPSSFQRKWGQLPISLDTKNNNK